MTLYKPTILVEKILLMKNALMVYEADFHLGLNIIHGENGSGKSTVTELIFYALGGEMIEWKYPANNCDAVYVQVSINGESTTLCREIIPGNPNAGMEIFWGNLKESRAASRSEWKKYPYRATDQKESFTQILFRAMEFPTVKAEEGSNITMNQILRLIYADQLTPGARLFKLQEKWDSGLLRQTVGDLLCGVYDDKLYEAKLELIRKNKILDVANTQLRNIFSILGQAEQDVVVLNYTQQVSDISNQLSVLHSTINDIKGTVILIDGRAASKIKIIEAGKAKEISKLGDKLLALKNNCSDLELDVIDSNNFIIELERRLLAIKDSENIGRNLGQIKFVQCPCCMAEVEDQSLNSNLCSLCKVDLNEGGRELNLLRMRNELELQIRESKRNLEIRNLRIQKIKFELNSINDARNEELRALKGFAKQWPTESEEKIDSANMEIGRLKQELIGLREKQKLQTLITNLQNQRGILTSEVKNLREFILSREDKQAIRQTEAYSAIEDFVVEILKQDLRRQDDFYEARKAKIDFDGNSILVNDIKTFSASSLVLLKNSFHLAFILAASSNEFFRYPRLLIMDGIEDGGMEESRSHNFQEIIKKYSDGLSVSHQIIFTTAKLSPKLNDKKYLIGPTYNKDNRTLKI
jgi:hypothetical protein